MSHIFGTYGPAYPWLGKATHWITKPFCTAAYAACGLFHSESALAREQRAAFLAKLERGEPVYLLGAVAAGQNAGVSLVEASQSAGLRVICNEEEERYTGIKYYSGYPQHSVEAVKRRMDDMGLRAQDIHACLSGWDYAAFLSAGMCEMFEHAPFSFALALPSSVEAFNAKHAFNALGAPKRLAAQLGLSGRMRMIAMRHHDNHAAFAFGVSPFGKHDGPVMASVLDGFGDDAAMSTYLFQDGVMKRLHSNHSHADSLGALYGIISSTQGGWPLLHSEGRYMGATAWGDKDRTTNPYYRRLRQIIYLGADGDVRINRSMANWHIWGEKRPYKESLRQILGPPISRKNMWNPDAVLKVDDVKHREISQAGVDKAAALQLVFEDALFHIIDHMIRSTGSDRLVMAGGTALNCIANMRLLEQFNEEYYARTTGQKTRLHLWVPPTPGDAGAAMGAAYNFALASGARPGEVLQHAFYCGAPPTTREIRESMEKASDIGHLPIGNIRHGPDLARITDFMAYIVSNDGVLGIYQGAAETGPRALGHRSIVSNPCSPNTLETINQLVKYREPFRPLAPMATYEAALRYFDLSDGARDHSYNAYNYMVLTVRALPHSARTIPAVIHRDGTARLQIVRQEIDPFCYAYLKAMGRRIGVEISVNTSLNVGGPIAQTPSHALETLRRSKGLTGLVLVGADGDAFLAWHAVDKPPKDAGKKLLARYEEWKLGNHEAAFKTM